MIKKIPDQIPVQTGEWRGTTFDIIPKETFGMACRKINELVDAVNVLQCKNVHIESDLQGLMYPKEIKCEAEPADPYAEQKPKYKTYNDLVWQDHNLAKEAKTHKDCFADWLYKDSKDAKHAIMHFDNDFGISVIKDCPFLTGNAVYECAVLQWHDGKYNLIYPSFAPDVVRLDTPYEINDLMRKIQEMPKCAHHVHDQVVLENPKD